MGVMCAGGIGGVAGCETPSFSAMATKMRVFWASLSISIFGMSGRAGIADFEVSPGNGARPGGVGGRVRLDVLKETSPASSYKDSKRLDTSPDNGVEHRAAAIGCVVLLLYLLLLLLL